MVIIIAIKAIPVIWSLGHILVEAVPAGINTHQLIKTIMKTIPQIRAVHSVHVWRYISCLFLNKIKVLFFFWF
jgi:Co/Zn/Cd efflux system component